MLGYFQEVGVCACLCLVICIIQAIPVVLFYYYILFFILYDFRCNIHLVFFETCALLCDFGLTTIQ